MSRQFSGKSGTSSTTKTTLAVGCRNGDNRIQNDFGRKHEQFRIQKYHKKRVRRDRIESRDKQGIYSERICRRSQCFGETILSNERTNRYVSILSKSNEQNRRFVSLF